MIIEESIRNRSDSSDGLPGSPINWLNVGAVVYGWTDRRDAGVDRAWWKTAGARYYVPWVKQQTAAELTEHLQVIATGAEAEVV